jgi:ribosome biogenesis GTPase A
MLRRSLLGRALAAGLRSRHASFAAASALARCAVGARTCLALLLVAGYAAPQKLALCLQLPQPKLRERKLGKKERLNIVLVGKTGHGKSSLANILCGDKSKFPVSDDLSR